MSLVQIMSSYVSQNIGLFPQKQLDRLSTDVLEKILTIYRENHLHRLPPIDLNFYVKRFHSIIRRWEISPFNVFGANQKMQIEVLPRLDRLEQLVLNQVSAKHLSEIDFPPLEGVKTLVLRNCSLPDEFYSGMKTLFPNMEILEIAAASIDVNLISSPKLVSLSLNSPSFSWESCQEVVRKLSEFPRLKTLELVFNIGKAKKNKKEITEALQSIPLEATEIQNVRLHYLCLGQTELCWQGFKRADEARHINVLARAIIPASSPNEKF